LLRLIEITDEIITIKNGFINSIGWNLGNGPPTSIHLLEPLTSTPIKLTKNKKIKKITNKIKELLKILFFSKKEKVNKIKNANSMKIKCLMKKSNELVFSFSEAIIEVETREKNKPKKNRDKIRNSINLSIFFHQT
tara:strand:+ start:285 stop:692 length:408 start_codon:yes stop_codon:yes gene_type:complete